MLSLMDATTVRPGNKALDCLVNTYSDRNEKFAHLVTCLPNVAASLFSDAKKTSESLLQRIDTREGVSQMFLDKCGTLADCVFDLMLVPCFEEIAGYCGDNELASVFVDALLYQATGREPGLPTEAQVLDEGTHHAHGIAKYKIARHYITSISDLAGWIFGKEYAVIVEGDAKDLARIMAVAPLSLAYRQCARWKVKYFLYGTLPSEDEQQKLSSAVEGSFETLAHAFTRIGREDSKD
jgi:hypothetical protein